MELAVSIMLLRKHANGLINLKHISILEGAKRQCEAYGVDERFLLIDELAFLADSTFLKVA